MIEEAQEPLETASPYLRVDLDWQAYFKEFCSIHGGDPIVYKGRLLFRDGWQYSKSDYAGPEWSPPADPRELKQLITAYWTRRREIVQNERNQLYLVIEELRLLQNHRSAPLQQTRVYANDTGQLVTSSSKFDIEILRSRLEWLDQDIADCDLQLSSNAQELSNAT